MSDVIFMTKKGLEQMVAASKKFDLSEGFFLTQEDDRLYFEVEANMDEFATVVRVIIDQLGGSK